MTNIESQTRRVTAESIMHPDTGLTLSGQTILKENEAADSSLTISIQNISNGRMTTPDMISFFEQNPPEGYSVEVLADGLCSVLQTARYSINASDFSKPVVAAMGTGGDMNSTANITTLGSIIASATEACIAVKYGNSRATGKFGAMDLFSALGINTSPPFEEAKELLHTIGYVPLHARYIYPGAANAAEARKIYGKPTVFNLLMPLAAPVKGNANFLLGVANPYMQRVVADILQVQSNGRSLIVRDEKYGLDEISTGVTRFYNTETNGDAEVIDVGELLDIPNVNLADLQAENPNEFVEIFLQTLDPSVNNARITALRNVACLNAAGMLFVSHENGDLMRDLPLHFRRAQEALYSGTAQDKLRRLQQIT